MSCKNVIAVVEKLYDAIIVRHKLTNILSKYATSFTLLLSTTLFSLDQALEVDLFAVTLQHCLEDAEIPESTSRLTEILLLVFSSLLDSLHSVYKHFNLNFHTHLLCGDRLLLQTTSFSRNKSSDKSSVESLLNREDAIEQSDDKTVGCSTLEGHVGIGKAKRDLTPRGRLARLRSQILFGVNSTVQL